MPPRNDQQRQTFISVLPIVFTVISLLVTLWTRATVAELRAAILEQQQERIERATGNLIPRHEFDQLTERVRRLEGARQ